MKQRNLLSQNDNELLRKDYQKPLCDVMQMPVSDAVRTSDPCGTPFQWDGGWEEFL